MHAHDRSILVIAAGYADAGKVDALPPLSLPAVAVEAGADGCLLDTAVKGDGTLFTNLNDDQLRAFTEECREAGLLCGLAGSLGADDIVHACRFDADLLGVRTAVCTGGRVHGIVDSRKVRHLKDLIAANTSPGSSPS